MRRPTGTQLAGYEAVLVNNLRRAVQALPLVQLVEVAPESRRKGQLSDTCATDEHSQCRAECDCECHDTWRGYSQTLPQDYQGVRNHPVGKTWHDDDTTSSKALEKRTSREWLQRFAQVERDLAWLVKHAIHLIGEPVQTCPCGMPIADSDSTSKSQGRTWHDRCYRRHKRGRPLTMDTV